MLPRPKLLIQVLAHGEGLALPRYETPGSAGLDLRAAIGASVVLQSLDRAAVPTGLIVAIPEGWEGQVRPRSGNALRMGLSMPNTPGTIDSDYRGELKVILVNLGREPVTIERGMRIAQLVVCPVGHAELVVVDEVPSDTVRGAGGFGSTGV
ncbi:MAG TPA: dUTP diphosphatase [Deltaproteobacteria bacterium]|nr:dUTP diphosphatase [Deltaproteobacteria bacterium]